MILLFTDFGWQGPYVGQLHLALAQEAPGIRVIDLMHDAPAFSPIAAGHLLSALVDRVPAEAVVVAVVDPGVGSARHPLLVEAAGRRFVGPDNGLLAPVTHRYEAVDVRIIEWRPPRLSASFHGRDLFAPAAARLVRGAEVATTPSPDHRWSGLVSRHGGRKSSTSTAMEMPGQAFPRGTFPRVLALQWVGRCFPELEPSLTWKGGRPSGTRTLLAWSR